MLIWVFVMLFEGVRGITNEDRLTRVLFNQTRYSPKFRPVKSHSLPIVVHHGLLLKMITDVDEKNMVLSTNVRLKMTWKDEMMTWSPTDYGGLKQINVEASDIWTPPIILYNKAQSEFQYVKPRAQVMHDGNVTWLVATVIQSACPIKVKYFPFDEQHCELIFGSWNYDVTKLNIQLYQRSVDVTRYLTNGEWRLRAAEAERTQVSHICCRNPVARITYRLHITRRRLFYIMNFILPCGIIAFLTLLVFLTPVESGERMAIGVTILLALAVFFLMLESTMPSCSELPLLAKFYCCTVVEVVCCMVAMTWILRLVHHSPDPLPNWIKKGVLGFLARLVRYNTQTNTTKPIKIEVQEQTNAEEPIKMKFANKWKKRAKSKAKSKEQAIVHVDSEAVNILAENVEQEEKTEKLKEQWLVAANILNWFFTCLFLFAVVVTMVIIFVVELGVRPDKV